MDQFLQILDPSGSNKVTMSSIIQLFSTYKIDTDEDKSRKSSFFDKTLTNTDLQSKFYQMTSNEGDMTEKVTLLEKFEQQETQLNNDILQLEMQL